MGKINSSQNGVMRGRIGNTVYRKGISGEVIAAQYQPQVRNPRTAKQAVQRMVLAASAKLASALYPIVDHSFQGVAVGNASVRHFRSKAMNYLRSVAATYLNDPTATAAAANFPIKGANIIGGAEGLEISSGKLALNPYVVVTDNAVGIALRSALAASFTTQIGYALELAKLGIEPGDQLTFVVFGRNPDNPVASFNIDGNVETDFADNVQFCRIVFKAVLPVDFSGGLIVDGAINPALIEESAGALPAISTRSATTTAPAYLVADFSDVMAYGYEMTLAAAVRSQKLITGEFAYSTAKLVRDNSTFDDNDADPTYYSYMDNVGEINVGDELYLKHAVATPFGTGEA